LGTPEQQRLQKKALHEKENIPLDTDDMVLAHMSISWMNHRNKSRKDADGVEKIDYGTITKERYLEIYNDNYQRCCYTGVRMTLGSAQDHLMVMSPERVLNQEGYHEPNVTFCLLRLNKFRNDSDYDAFREHIKFLYGNT